MKELDQNLEQLDVIGENSERTVFKEIVLDLKEVQKVKEFDGAQSLYLFMHTDKEYPPLYRHAWGYAWVSTRKDGRDIFPVSKLTFKLKMPVLSGKFMQDTEVINGKKKKANVDCRFGGTIFGNFESYWFAEAEHPRYGKWHISNKW